MKKRKNIEARLVVLLQGILMTNESLPEKDVN